MNGIGKYKGWIVLGIIVFSLIFLVVTPLISYGNQQIELASQINATQKANTVVYDRVWKVIQQQAEISGKYSEDFRSIYKDIMDARNPDGQAKLVKFVKEANPNFDSSLFSKLMNTIESNRKDFEREQKRLIDLEREQSNLFGKLPSSIYLSILGRKPIPIQLVTSTRTDDAFRSGKDDDTKLFPNGNR